MSSCQYNADFTLYEENNSNSDDTDTEEQKMLELEALLYSKIHYAEDLPNDANDIMLSEKENESNKAHKNQIPAERTLQNIDPSLKKRSEQENNDISTLIYDEIINAKKTHNHTNQELQSDSGMSSDQEETAISILTNSKSTESNYLDTPVQSNSNKFSNEKFDTSNCDTDVLNKSDSKYSNTRPRERNHQGKTLQHDSSALKVTEVSNSITISSSDTETSSDEDSGIRVLGQVDKNNKSYPLIDLESDDSCDESNHDKFLEGLQDMDKNLNVNETTKEVIISSSSSSDSEIELLPNLSNKFSGSKKNVTPQPIKSKSVPNSIPSEAPEVIQPIKESLSNSSQLKSRITVIDQQDSKKKMTPKNIVTMSSNSELSSSDEESVLGNTSISLNLIGQSDTIDNSNESSRLSFDEITCQEFNPLNANVREQCSMLNINRDEVIVRNWTPEMYKFYNEVNKDDGKKNYFDFLNYFSVSNMKVMISFNVLFIS